MTAPKDVWPEIIRLAYEYFDPNERANIIQSAQCEYGPVPEGHQESVKELLKSTKPKTFHADPS